MTGQISGIIVNNAITFILGDTTGLYIPASCSSSVQRPILWGKLSEWIPDPTELPPLITVPVSPHGFLRVLTGTLWAAGGAINSQNVKKLGNKRVINVTGN